MCAAYVGTVNEQSAAPCCSVDFSFAARGSQPAASLLTAASSALQPHADSVINGSRIRSGSGRLGLL